MLGAPVAGEAERVASRARSSELCSACAPVVPSATGERSRTDNATMGVSYSVTQPDGEKPR